MASSTGLLMPTVNTLCSAGVNTVFLARCRRRPHAAPMRSESPENTPWGRFEQLLDVLGIDRVTVIKEIDVSQQNLTNWKRRQLIGAEGAQKLRRKYGVSPDWLNHGVGPMFLADPEHDADLVQLIGRYRRMSPSHRKAVLHLVNSIAETDAPPYKAKRPDSTAAP